MEKEYWGDAIITDCKPDWLDNDVPVLFQNEEDGGWWGELMEPGYWKAYKLSGECPLYAIRIPADHPYYIATSKGFTYWPGGNAAPADWDGGEVLLACGRVIDQVLTWGKNDDESIMGYKCKADAPETEAESLLIDADDSGDARYFSAIPGYAGLASILFDALEQAQRGKGAERHANDRVFEDQPIMEISRMIGTPAGAVFQVCKKSQEAVGMWRRGNADAAERELLGAIVYAGAAIMAVREMKVGTDD